MHCLNIKAAQWYVVILSIVVPSYGGGYIRGSKVVAISFYSVMFLVPLHVYNICLRRVFTADLHEDIHNWNSALGIEKEFISQPYLAKYQSSPSITS